MSLLSTILFGEFTPPPAVSSRRVRMADVLPEKEFRKSWSYETKIERKRRESVPRSTAEKFQAKYAYVVSRLRNATDYVGAETLVTDSISIGTVRKILAMLKKRGQLERRCVSGAGRVRYMQFRLCKR